MSEDNGITIQQIVMWNVYVIYFVLVALSIYWVINGAVKKEINTSDITNDVYILKFLEDNDCLAYGEGDASKIGIIDVKKFNSETLDKCLKRQGFSAKLLVKYNDKNITVYNNENVYGLDSRLCFSPRYKCKSKKYYTLVADEGKFYNASLDASVVLNVD